MIEKNTAIDHNELTPFATERLKKKKRINNRIVVILIKIKGIGYMRDCLFYFYEKRYSPQDTNFLVGYSREYECN